MISMKTAKLCSIRHSGVRAMSTLFRDKAYVNGKWIGAGSGSTFQVKNPVNGSVIASVPDMDGKDTSEAISAAHLAFASWKETTAKERSGLLRKWFDVMIKNQVRSSYNLLVKYCILKNSIKVLIYAMSST